MSEGLNVTRDAGAARESAVRNEFTREVEDNHRIGRVGLTKGRGRRLWGYDRDQGAVNATLRGGADKADRLSVEEAARLLSVIHSTFRVDRQMEGFLYDFDHAMFICYTLNGGSQFTPTNRVKFYVGTPTEGGYEHSFSFATVHEILGVNFRRFFRTFANAVIAACRQVIEHCDFEDAEMVDIRQQLILLAQARNIARYPHLCADCADAATDVSSNEFHAIMQSKATVIAGAANSVDKRSSAFPIRSADNYDSSVGASVSNQNDVHATGPVYYA